MDLHARFQGSVVHSLKENGANFRDTYSITRRKAFTGATLLYRLDGLKHRTGGHMLLGRRPSQAIAQAPLGFFFAA